MDDGIHANDTEGIKVMNKPIISVIMSVKNGEFDLAKSIGSIQAQTLSDWELIVCDDGSTDKTLDVLNNLAEADSRIIVLHNDKSQGSAQARDVCIEIAKSNFLAIHDADDYSAPNRFELQYDFMQKHPEYAIVGTGYYTVKSDGTIIGECHPKTEPTAMDQIKGGEFMHPSFMMRKDMIAKVGFYTISPYTLRSQDYHMVMKVLGAGMKMYNMNECLYYYTADEGMMNRTRSWKRVKGLMWIRWDAYRRNHLPWWCYIYVLKPFVTNLIPKSIMFRYHKKTFKTHA